MKICSSCNEKKEEKEFPPKSGRCKHCRYLENLAWRENNKDKVSKFNASRYETNHSGTLDKISKIPLKVIKEKKPAKVKIMKPERQTLKRVTMVRVHSTETRNVKLVRNDWDKVLSGIKQQIERWEVTQ